MSEVIKSNTYNKATAVLAATLLVAGCTSQEGSDASDGQTSKRWDFSVECPEGFSAGIVEAATSDTVLFDPNDPEPDLTKRRVADSFIAITCFGGNGEQSVPLVELDDNEGRCLGFKEDETEGNFHLRINTVGDDGPVEYFLDDADKRSSAIKSVMRIGIVGGEPTRSGEHNITSVNIHDHMLPEWQSPYERDNC